jgi:hypothetical protein
VHAGVVLAQLGAEVTATDLPQNLPLLRDNTEANGTLLGLLLSLHSAPPTAALSPEFWTSTPVVTACLTDCCDDCCKGPENLPLEDFSLVAVGLENVPIRVLEHCWGTDAATLKPPFDVVVACGG